MSAGLTARSHVASAMKAPISITIAGENRRATERKRDVPHVATASMDRRTEEMKWAPRCMPKIVARAR